jgi:protein-disulfide isomerase
MMGGARRSGARQDMSEMTGNNEHQASRRDVLTLFGAGVATVGMMPALAQAQGREPGEAAVLRDPDIAVAGNPDGDSAIVEWFDYQCPYCRKLEPELRQVVHDDGKVRLLLKDWPILGPVSVVAARMALACKYQGKYVQAHEALMGVNSKLTEARIDELIRDAGIDLDRAKSDLAGNARAIDAILARNNGQAGALGFRGTPSFIVGKFRVPGVLTMAQFEQVIADARKAKMGR